MAAGLMVATFAGCLLCDVYGWCAIAPRRIQRRCWAMRLYLQSARSARDMAMGTAMALVWPWVRRERL